MEITFENKETLIKAASEGRMVLFLGAGVNVGCQMGIHPKPAPLGEQLGNELSQEFFPEEIPKGSLKSITQKIINIKGESALRDFLYQRLHPVSPSSSIKQIPQIPWAAIYTVNIDSALETILFT